MSYILDALRRADGERQRHVPRTPELTPGPARPTAARAAPWPVIGVVATVVLAAAVAWFWIAADAPTGPAGADLPTTPARPQQVTAMPTTAPPTAPAPALPEAPPAPAALAPAPRAGAVIAAVTIPAPERTKTPETAGNQRPPPASVPAADPPSPGGTVPAWRDLPPAQRQALPHPRLDVHVHAADPARRFVMIELQKYREGDTLPNGGVLERIDAEGVVLDYRGQRYTLPRR